MTKPAQLSMVDKDGAIAPLNDAATSYAEARDDRQEMGRIEKERKDKLIALMVENGRTDYAAGGVTVRMETTTSTAIKVTVASPAE